MLIFCKKGNVLLIRLQMFGWLLSGDCSFETGMCAYTNVKTKAGTTTESDEFDWVIGSGATPSSFTGPSTDHTTGSAQGNNHLISWEYTSVICHKTTYYKWNDSNVWYLKRLLHSNKTLFSSVYLENQSNKNLNDLIFFFSLGPK